MNEGNIKQTSAERKRPKWKKLSPRETKDRIIALCLVFAVVIFFWMAFHQNGLTLTYFADEFTAKSSTGLESMMFDVWNLVAIIFIVYGLFSLFQSSTGKGKAISGIVILLAFAFLGYRYSSLNGSVPVDAPIFQQFNPFFVVALTPVSMAIFGALSRKGKEPSAPRKIGLGMLVAACRIHLNDVFIIRPIDSRSTIRSNPSRYCLFRFTQLVNFHLFGSYIR